MSLGKEGTILYVSSVDISLPNGPGVNEREFVISLTTALGRRALILIPEPKNPLDDINHDRCTYYAAGFLPGRLSVLANQVTLARRVRSLVRRHHVDLIVARVGALPFALRHLVRSSGIPLAVKTLGDTGFLRRYTGFKGALGRVLAPIHENLIRGIVKNALAVDVCTPQLAETIKRRFDGDSATVSLIPNSTNTDRFCPMERRKARVRLGFDRFDPVIGFVGGHPASRGGRQMITIAPRIVRDHPALGVVIVGSRDEQLEALAIKIGVGDRCVFPGVVPYEQIPDYINSFDVGFALETSERVGIVGNSFQKIRQYVACGVPAIASKGGSEFLTESDLGSIVASDDNDAIERETLRWLSMSEEHRRAFRLRASAFARRQLSTASALRNRLDFWDVRIRAIHRSRHC